mmetsp:Transcript_9875/g.17770  ORF Transcript_9875/g.17770 Transcript_9875/m.17770 type:complete len:208 (-) Transcript_9875:160-783(-)
MLDASQPGRSSNSFEESFRQCGYRPVHSPLNSSDWRERSSMGLQALQVKVWIPGMVGIVQTAYAQNSSLWMFGERRYILSTNCGHLCNVTVSKWRSMGCSHTHKLLSMSRGWDGCVVPSMLPALCVQPHVSSTKHDHLANVLDLAKPVQPTIDPTTCTCAGVAARRKVAKLLRGLRKESALSAEMVSAREPLRGFWLRSAALGLEDG